jgi:hypothetical protein
MRIPMVIRFSVKSLPFSTTKTFRIHRKPCLSYARCAVYFIKINNNFYEINGIRINTVLHTYFEFSRIGVLDGVLCNLSTFNAEPIVSSSFGGG